MQRISNTIRLAKASWAVLKADKELLALPVISAIATALVAITFLAPIFAISGFKTEDLGLVDYVLLGVMYVTLAYITIFFNAALVHAADERLNGGDPTLRTAIAGAWSKAGRILPWAIISATVSLILRAVEERAGFVGQIVVGLVGIAWALVTFLVIPILVLEDIRVVDAIKRSGSLFKQTWGENVAAQFGFGILGFIAALPAIAIGALGIAAGGVTAGVAIVFAVLWIALVAVVLSCLNAIFQAALYHYAVAGETPGDYFPQSTFSSAFAPRKRRGLGGGAGGGF
ncbi:MAG: DUF6159 family protein, partial [Gaiellaceae bacterium]